MSCPSVTVLPHTARSRVANGSELLPGIDGRSAWARRYRDLIDALASDLGGTLTEAERQQVRTAAGAQLHVEQLTAAMVRGESVSSEDYTRASNGATRALAALKRAAKSTKPKGQSALADYLARRAAVTA